MDHELDDLQEEQEETEETESPAESAEVEEVIHNDSPPPVSENTLKHYLNSISRYKPLSKEQEFEIGERIQRATRKLSIPLYSQTLNSLYLSQTATETRVCPFPIS
ncbi:MAG: hypothetical protein LRY51_07775 [Geovibrio sp.]|nr:hypothetical protein [Geovibrio sp.]